MKQILIAASEMVIIDSITQNSSLINIIDQLNISSFPGMFSQIYICSYFLKEANDEGILSGQIVIRNNDIEVGKANFEVDFKGHDRTRAIVVISAITILQPGELSFTPVVGTTSYPSWIIRVVAQLGAVTQT